MPISTRLQAWFASVFFSLYLLTGCDSTPADKSVAVTGTLTNSGQPLKVEMAASGAGWVELRFYPVDTAGAIGELNYQTMVNEKGEFKVLGPSNKGLPPGKYRVIVRQWEPYPTLDKLGGKYDETNSTITREVAGPTKIELDLAKLTP